MIDSRQFLDQLLTESEKHGLVLFVGSGINAEFLPQWKSLLIRLLGKTINEAGFEDERIARMSEDLLHWCIKHFDMCAQASLIKHILKIERYRLEIQSALYGNYPDIENQVREYCLRKERDDAYVDEKFEYLWATAKLCSSPQVKAVATFNFDTLLETAIDACNTKSSHAYFGHIGKLATPGGADHPKPIIPVYHIHGLLSPPESLLRDIQESVIFSSDEYFNRNADPYSWETATSLHLLRHYCTLWLGSSLKDWNMMRLLNAAKTKSPEINSYCLQCLDDVSDKQIPVDFKEAAMRFQSTLFDSVSVHLIVAGDSFSSLPDFISEKIISGLLQNHNNSGRDNRRIFSKD